MALHTDKPEAPKKAPSASESVDGLIKKKQNEKQAEVSAGLEAKKAGIHEAVDEVMGGMEKPSEKISERKGESGEKGDIKGGGQTSGNDDGQSQTINVSIKDYHFPSEEIMVKKIRTAITAQIKHEWKKAKKSSKKLGTGGSSEYNESIAKIRKLKTMLSSIFTSTVNLMKEMYVKYFTPDGQRRQINEID